MASKLYPTLSAFYKAGNIGFGSEQDAMLGGVPEEKLYRKPSRQRAELPLYNPHETTLQPDIPGQLGTNIGTETQESRLPQVQPEEGHTSPPLTPSAPPLLDMLDLRLQQYLNMLLAPNNASNLNSVFPADNTQTDTSVLQPGTNPEAGGSNSATVTLPLPPNVVVEDSWLDEIQPDYDDLTPEEMADEILNNLNVAREEDAKDTEKQKSLSLLRMPKDLQGEMSRGEEKKQSHQAQHHQYPHLEDQNLRHGYQQQQSSQSSRDDNEDSDGNQHHYHKQQQRNLPRHRHHNDRHRHQKSHGAAARLQERQSKSRDDLRQNPSRDDLRQNASRDDLRLAGRTKRQESVEKLPDAVSNDPAGRDRRRDAAYPHRRSHHNVSRSSRHETGQPVTDPVDGQRESGKPSPRRKSSAAEKENHKGSPGENSDYNAWMTWRKQVNRQLATIILLKQQGKEVSVQTTDMRRKPLRQSSIDFVSQIATQSGSTTSLGGKPYVMYGIPRASLLPKNETAENKGES